MNQCFCVCAATRVALGGASAAKRPVETRGSSQGPSGEARRLASVRKMAAMALAAVSVGDNGSKSKTGSLLRGSAEPASELIKQLLCILEGTACLMSDTARGILASLWPCKKKKEKETKTKTIALVIYGACRTFIVNSFG